MELVPEGPEADALRARMQEVMSRHRADVQRRSPVYGLAEPNLAPRVLGASDTTGVTLHAGELVSATGPMVSVRTAHMSPGVARVRATEATVPDQMADEHARLGDHVGLAEPEELATALGDGQLWLAGARVPAEVYRDTGLAAARAVLEPESVIVTVISRGVPLEEVRLTTVDVEPYRAGREAYLAGLAAHHLVSVRPEELDLPPSHGLDAHHDLVHFCLTESAAVRARLHSGRRPRSAPGAAQQRQRLWEAAVRAHMRLADQDRKTADEHVTQIVNTLIGLARRTWFAEPALRASAIDQVLGYQVFDADVPTREAQQLWQRSWEQRRARPALADGWPRQIWRRTQEARTAPGPGPLRRAL